MQFIDNSRSSIRLVNFGGLLIWLAVGVGLWGAVSIWGSVGFASNYYYSLPIRIAIPSFYILFGVAFLFGCRLENNAITIRVILSIIQLISAFAITFLLNTNVAMALFVQFVSQIVFYIKLKWCMLIILAVTIILYFILEFYWGRGQSISTAGLVGIFMFFIAVSNHYAVGENMAKEMLAITNRELLSTQLLLSETSKQSERIRIARNIHDLVGHHLTALSINLEIASHLSTGRPKDQIDKAHSISKLLLSDVREAVSEIRKTENINLTEALETLVAGLPKLDVDLNISDDVEISDAKMADVILRCVQEALTNSLKHAQAKEIKIVIKLKDNDILLDIKDDGIGLSNLDIAGNGLTGMRERVMSIGGYMHIETAEQKGFHIMINLPAQEEL